MKQFLVVVDDSAAALRAAQLAIDLAAATGAGLTLVTVVEDHVLDARLNAASVPDAAARRAQGAVSVLTRMTARASLRGLRTHQEILSGHGAEQVLAMAARCGADLIVAGRDPGAPVNLANLLEFADVPVLVVPAEAV
ncbi:universal stress protein [Kribbella sindirgiensis]|uniref:Universal stress protein n=1 Tax=Kribbella sindirgiensis TaxID=1124744 RepID=A0A4R0I4R3_9ACTN|nr:universal stress protein [Kribbella sindirgiensis]TCC21608.1 universal stress protein [Kribbella sindirgiensis]